MKIFLIALLLCITKLCIAQQENYLYGDPARKYNVKKVTEYYYSGNDTTTAASVMIRIFHNNKEDSVYSIIKGGAKKLIYVDIYNDAGQLAGYNFYVDGTNDAKSIFKYDEKGHRVEFDSYSYYQGNTMEVKMLYKYDNNGKMSEQDVYSFHGEFSNRILYVYNDKGLETEETWNNPSEATPMGKYTFQYDERGNKSQSINYNKFGEAQSSDDSKYSNYDQYNNWRYMTNASYMHTKVQGDMNSNTIIKRVIEYY